MSQQQFDNTNRFQLWKNTEKQTDKHPDYSGSLNVNGVEYFIDGWLAAPDANPKAPKLSGKIKIKTKQSGNVEPDL